MKGAGNATLDAAEALRRVADCWDRTVLARQENPLMGWLDSPEVAALRLDLPVSGWPSVNWLVGLARRLGIAPSSRWLSIGCGAAGKGIDAAEQGLFASLDAIDISRAALDEGRRVAAGAEDIESSRSWKAVQTLRGLFGRRW